MNLIFEEIVDKFDEIPRNGYWRETSNRSWTSDGRPPWMQPGYRRKRTYVAKDAALAIAAFVGFALFAFILTDKNILITSAVSIVAAIVLNLVARRFEDSPPFVFRFFQRWATIAAVTMPMFSVASFLREPVTLPFFKKFVAITHFPTKALREAMDTNPRVTVTVVCIIFTGAAAHALVFAFFAPMLAWTRSRLEFAERFKKMNQKLTIIVANVAKWLCIFSVVLAVVSGMLCGLIDTSFSESSAVGGSLSQNHKSFVEMPSFMGSEK